MARNGYDMGFMHNPGSDMVPKALTLSIQLVLGPIPVIPTRNSLDSAHFHISGVGLLNPGLITAVKKSKTVDLSVLGISLPIPTRNGLDSAHFYISGVYLLP